MSGYVLQVEDRFGSRSVPIERFPFTIGRGSENHLVIPENSVSRHHAYLRQAPEGVTVVDNESRNGIFVNNEKVTEARTLAPGDVLRIGSARLRLGQTGQPEIRLRAGAGGETLQFFPSRDSWDSLKSLAAGFPRAAPEPMVVGQERRAIDWQRLLTRLFLGATSQEMYEQILDALEEFMAFDRCLIILFEGGKPERMRIAAKRFRRDPGGECIVSSQILRRVAQGREAVIVTSADDSSIATQSFIRSGAATAACVPLIVADGVTGVIYLDRVGASSELVRDDVEALGPLAGLVALKIENLRLLEEQIASRVLRRDLELAKDIQEGLFPQVPALVPGYAVEGYTSPCFEVGGDYYDYLPAKDGALTLLIGDVSGKGLPSALYMAGIRAALHAHVEDGLEIEELLSRLDGQVRRTFRSDHFLTLVLSRLDPGTGVLRYSNAGHLPLMVLDRAGQVTELEATDPALNIGAGGAFHCLERSLAPGDLVLFYTDGLTEAESPSGEQYGSERLAACLTRLRDQDLPAVRKGILSDIEAFSEGAGKTDDRTLILLRREEA